MECSQLFYCVAFDFTVIMLLTICEWIYGYILVSVWKLQSSVAKLVKSQENMKWQLRNEKQCEEVKYCCILMNTFKSCFFSFKVGFIFESLLCYTLRQIAEVCVL